MCTIYGAPAELTEALMALAKETKSKGWWHAYGDVIPEYFDVYVGLEEAAASLSVYESDVVHGLLQTEDYARQIIRTHFHDIGDEELARRVQLRIERQTLVTRVTAPPMLRVVLSEATLRRPIGGRRCMAAQLAHLVYVSELPNLDLRIAPFAAGPHAGIMTGPFIILRFPPSGDGTEAEPPTVYADGFTGGLYLDKPPEVQRYDAAFQEIWQASLDEQASRRLLAEVAGSYEQQG